jgi:hypothetical protein
MFRAACCTRPRGALAIATLLAFAAAPLVAHAQTDDERAGARAAASEGLRAFEAKKWSDAIDLFTRAESLVHAPPHLLYLARANVQLGHVVKARELYLKIRNENITPDKPRAFQEAKTDAETELAALEPTLAYVKVIVNGAAGKPFSMTVDGAPVSSALAGVSRPIDPGDHQFQAIAQGFKSDLVLRSIKKGASEAVTLDLKPSADAVLPVAGGSEPQSGPTPAPAPSTTSMGPPPGAATEQAPSGGSGEGVRVASYVMIGVGVVGVGLGTALALVANGQKSDADSKCNLAGGGCPGALEDSINQTDNAAKRNFAISYVGFAVGGAALVTGVALLFVGHGGAAKEGAHVGGALSPAVHLWVGPGSAGLAGTF